MSCGCGCSEYPSLMGAIPQQLSSIAGGASFQFGYNIGYTLNPFNVDDVTDLLQEQIGLSYDTHTYVVAGTLNPYIAVEGYAVTTWPSASQFAEQIYQAIKGAGFPIDYASIQFRFEPTPNAQASTPKWSGTPYPDQSKSSSNSLSVPHAPDGSCSLTEQNPADWLACELGITPTLALVAGGIAGAAILLLVLKR